MSLQSYQKFIEAVRNTKILRSRKNHLFTFGNTILPYIILANSSINLGNCIIRTGEVVVEKPQILVANDLTSFEGFESEKNDKELDQVRFALMSRGILLPQMNYKNSTQRLNVISDKLEVAVEREMNRLEDANDSRTGVIQCNEDTWNLALLHYVLTQIARSSSSNMQEYFERYPLG